MKICIIGTHSTGKTTLVNELAKHFKNKGKQTKTISELSRLCPHPINETTSIDAQTWILNEQMRYEDLYQMTGSWVFCDRGTIDNFAYLERAANDQPIDHLLTKAVEHMKTYDLVFKTVKLDKKAIEDGVRSTDDEFRDDIDARITRLLEEHDIAHVLLPESLDVGVHVGFVDQLITNN